MTVMLANISLSSWLNNYLIRRQLTQADGRPIYAYHTSNMEYEELKNILQLHFRTDVLDVNKTLGAVFSLFCAEWYRREYEQSYGWTWEPIWELLGVTFTSNELEGAITKGLVGYWNRSVHIYSETERRNFLGSLFSEGGLPFKMLHLAGSRFQQLFSKILEQYHQAELLGKSITELTSVLIEKAGLPQVFSQPTSVQLIAGMVERLVSFVQLYGLESKADPARELDRLNPLWRDDFPIPLDDETGAVFLRGLLNSATQETKRVTRRAARLTCIHYLQPHNATIYTEITLPESITFELDKVTSVSRLELGLFEGDTQVAHLGVGYAQFKDHKAVLSVRQQEVECPRKSPSESLYFVAMQGGLVLSKLLIEHSSVELGEVPLGFDLVHEKWRLIGQASFASRASELMLLLPESADIEMVEGELTEAPLVVGYRTQMLAGEAKISVSQQDVYRIRTGVVSAADQGLVLSGRELYWASKPSLIYAGLPSFRWATGELHAHQGLQLWLSGQPLNELPLSARYGRQSISVKNSQGETLLRKQVGILPEDFTIELKTSQLPNQGSVIFRTATKCIFRVLDESMTFRRVSTDGAIELQLTVEGIPPAKVVIEVTFNLMSEPVVLELPFPASGVLAFDGEQKPLARSLTTSDLLGSRLFLFAREDNPVRYALELRLVGNHTTPVGHNWRYTAIGGPLEISLHSMKDEIEALMSLSHDLDHAVELVIKGGGVESAYRFQRYATNLDIDYDRGVLFSRGEILRAATMPQPTLMLINEPERSSTLLPSRLSEGTQTGEFELPSIIEKNGPWLIVPANQSAVKFRPKFIVGAAQLPDPVAEIKTLQQACLVFNPKTNKKAFNGVLDKIAQDPEHTGWLFLRTLYKNYGYLPLSTFEVWRALVKHPQALAMALFKFEMSVEFIRQLELDFPLFWEFLPLQYLQNAKNKLATALAGKGIPSDMITDLFNKWSAKLAQSLPSYAGDLGEYLSTGTQPQPLPSVVMKMAIDGWYQDLMRNHFEAVWPERFGPQLLSWYSLQTDLPIRLKTHSSFHNAVVYMPIFAAAVATGRANSEDVFGQQPENIFFARQLREFDLDWFGPVFQFCLLSYQKINESK